MRGVLQLWIVCMGLGVVETAGAAPRPAPCASLRHADELVEGEAYDQAIAIADACLAAGPRQADKLAALLTKGLALKGMRDYKGAEAAYRTYVAAASPGANRRAIEQRANDMRIAQSTFLDITVTNGPATIYLDVEAQVALCTAAPSCKQMALPRSTTVIARRPGFERWSQRVAVRPEASTPIAITLVEKPSLVTVRASPPGAQTTVDGAPYAAPVTLPAGKHRVAVALAGHASVQRDIDAHEGKPVELDLALPAVIPIALEPAGAKLLLDGKPVAIENGGIAVEPDSRELVARSPGFTEQRIAIPAARAADYRIAISLAHAAEARTGERGAFTPRRKIAIAVGGLAVGAGAAGVLLGLGSRSLEHDAFARCPSASTPCLAAAEATDLNERARARALHANIAFGAAGAAAVAAAILWFTGAPEGGVAILPRVSSVPGAGSVAGIDLTARF
jgi:PEGA domain